MVRFHIRITQRLDATHTLEGWQLAVEREDDPSFTRPPRGLRISQTGYPLPPLDEEPTWHGQTHADLCTDDTGALVGRLHRQVLAGDPTPQNLQIFGRYLFSVLLGTHWASIEGAVESGVAIELALDLPSDERALHRLPWEMMFRGDLPLCIESSRTVAIVRLIAADPVPMPVLELPLRVLFVLGKQMDADLRPGAEYVGLLRQLNATAPAGSTEVKTVGLHLRLLPEATSDDLIEAVGEFDPAIVHFICHGRWAGETSQILLSSPKLPNQAQGDEAPCDPDRLLTLLRRPDTDTPPPVVVLNACHTGEPNDAHLAFAAKLVAGGVAAAVGMAGEVDDGVCRIFTRAFYEALLRERPLALAAADGRLAAMRHYKNFMDNVEWARPTLFMAAGTRPSFAIDRTQQMFALAAQRLRPRRPPLLMCDRYDAVRDYQQLRRRMLVAGDGALALGFEVTLQETGAAASGNSATRPQLGKTRLLEELAALAVLDGFVPCLLRSVPAIDPPKNLLDFALLLAKAMNEVREKFDLTKRTEAESEALRVALSAYHRPERIDTANPRQFGQDRAFVEAEVKKLPGGTLPEGVDVTAVQTAIAADVKDLLGEISAMRAVLILIDDLHRYEGSAAPLMDCIGQYGLGTRQAPAPVVFTYALRAGRGPDILERISDRPDLFSKSTLQPFQAPHEWRLAYGQYLLHRQPPVSPSWKRDQKDNVELLFARLHYNIQGIPSNFELSAVDQVIGTALDFKVCIESDYEAIMNE
jgi:CHAT domain